VYDETVHKLFIDFKKASDSIMRGVLYNIRIEFVVPMKLVRLITICLNETLVKFVYVNIFLIMFLFKMV
jgi:hypothetical protein